MTSLQDNIDLLAGLPIFSKLEPEALRSIGSAAEKKVLRAGDVLFRQGDPSDGGYVIVSGAVALDASQSAAVAGKIVGPGGLMGELALLVATRHPATAIARQSTTILKIPRVSFLEALETSPVSAARLKRSLSRDLAAFSGELEKTRQTLLE